MNPDFLHLVLLVLFLLRVLMALDLAMDEPPRRCVLVGGAAASQLDNRRSGSAMATGRVVGARENLEIRGPRPPAERSERSRKKMGVSFQIF